MFENWILHNIEELDMKLYKDIIKNGFDPLVTGVNMDGTIQSMDLVNESAKK
jgi:hypothetical protein